MVEGVVMEELVDTGAQVSTIMEGFCTKFSLKIQPLEGLLHLNMAILIPYKGYIEVNLLLPGLTQYNKDVLFVAISYNTYGERVPVQFDTLTIDHFAVNMITQELQQAGGTWKQVCLRTIISKTNTIDSPNVLSMI